MNMHDCTVCHSKVAGTRKSDWRPSTEYTTPKPITDTTRWSNIVSVDEQQGIDLSLVPPEWVASSDFDGITTSIWIRNDDTYFWVNVAEFDEPIKMTPFPEFDAAITAVHMLLERSHEHG